jgi:dUTPase
MSALILNQFLCLGGVIDNDFTGTINVILHNNSLRIFNVYHANRVAQLSIIEKPKFQTQWKDNNGKVCNVQPQTKVPRKTGSFGSTGI